MAFDPPEPSGSRASDIADQTVMVGPIGSAEDAAVGKLVPWLTNRARALEDDKARLRQLLTQAHCAIEAEETKRSSVSENLKAARANIDDLNNELRVAKVRNKELGKVVESLRGADTERGGYHAKVVEERRTERRMVERMADKQQATE